MLTQPIDYRNEMNGGTQFAARALRRKYPELTKTMLSRPKRYNDTVCFCHQLEKKQPQNTVLLQPTGHLESFEKDVKKLEWGYEMGYNMACARMDDIKRLFD